MYHRDDNDLRQTSANYNTDTPQRTFYRTNNQQDGGAGSRNMNANYTAKGGATINNNNGGEGRRELQRYNLGNTTYTGGLVDKRVDDALTADRGRVGYRPTGNKSTTGGGYGGSFRRNNYQQNEYSHSQSASGYQGRPVGGTYRESRTQRGGDDGGRDNRISPLVE